MVAEAKAKYIAGPEKAPPVRHGTQDFRDLSKHAAFGMWADRTESDEELLDELRSGWGPPPRNE
jgi:hypothetical protein